MKGLFLSAMLFLSLFIGSYAYAQKGIMVTNHPENAVVPLCETAVFSVMAEGENLKYQWEKLTDDGGWTAIDGETSNLLIIHEVTDDQDNLKVRCRISSPGFREVYTKPAVLILDRVLMV